MNKLASEDFNVCMALNEYYVRISEISKMIKCGAIIVDKEKLEQYK